MRRAVRRLPNDSGRTIRHRRPPYCVNRSHLAIFAWFLVVTLVLELPGAIGAIVRA